MAFADRCDVKLETEETGDRVCSCCWDWERFVAPGCVSAKFRQNTQWRWFRSWSLEIDMYSHETKPSTLEACDSDGRRALSLGIDSANHLSCIPSPEQSRHPNRRNGLHVRRSRFEAFLDEPIPGRPVVYVMVIAAGFRLALEYRIILLCIIQVVNVVRCPSFHRPSRG